MSATECLPMLLEAQKALVFANALLYERNPPVMRPSAHKTTTTFLPQLPPPFDIRFSVERLGLALYVSSGPSQHPLSILVPSPTLALLSATLVDALQHVQLLIRNAQAELTPQ